MYAVYHNKDPLRVPPATHEQPVHTLHPNTQQISNQNEKEKKLVRDRYKKGGTGSGTGSEGTIPLGFDPLIDTEDEDENESLKGK